MEPVKTSNVQHVSHGLSRSAYWTLAMDATSEVLTIATRLIPKEDKSPFRDQRAINIFIAFVEKCELAFAEINSCHDLKRLAEITYAMTSIVYDLNSMEKIIDNLAKTPATLSSI